MNLREYKNTKKTNPIISLKESKMLRMAKRIKPLMEAGLTGEKIAEKVNADVTTVRRYIRKIKQDKDFINAEFC